jgi:hypothetical protein
MSPNPGSVRNALRANYGWASRGLHRWRPRRLLIIAAADIVGISVALGAIHLVGRVISSGHFETFVAATNRTGDDIPIRHPITTARSAPVSPVLNAAGVSLTTDEPIAFDVANSGELTASSPPPDTRVIFAKPEIVQASFTSTPGVRRFEHGWQQAAFDEPAGPEPAPASFGSASGASPGGAPPSQAAEHPSSGPQAGNPAATDPDAGPPDAAPPSPRPRPARHVKPRHERQIAMIEDVEPEAKANPFGLVGGISVTTGLSSSNSGTSGGVTGVVGQTVGTSVGVVSGTVGAVGGIVGGVVGGITGGR